MDFLVGLLFFFALMVAGTAAIVGFFVFVGAAAISGYESWVLAWLCVLAGSYIYLKIRKIW